MNRHDLQINVSAGAAMALMAVPQGVAYALIAGLPPAAGLYAAALPTILASMFRSSTHVVTGPTNAVSLLVGSAIASGIFLGDPMVVALQLALLVGLFQFGAGLLRFGAIVDYISRPVVLGYITGAATLIGLGQLGNITATPMGTGDPFTRLATWTSGLAGIDWRTVALALATIVVMVALKRIAPKAPGAAVVLVIGVLLSWAFDFRAMGLAVAGDLAPTPAGLPPLTWPSIQRPDLALLVPVAIAATVLSLVESSAVARSIASQTGERLDMNREFMAQGVANVSASLTGGYPVSGSLSRSALNHTMGATSRLAGVISGLLMVVVLLVLGPVVDLTPVASLAGLLMVVAWDLIDRGAIRTITGALLGDRLAFVGTVIGTWTLPLDTAIYLGVGISVALFLWRVHFLRVSELIVTNDRIRESKDVDSADRCQRVRALHIEGNLFFGAASELQDALDAAVRDSEVRVLVLRLKRARGLDYTTAGVLIAMQERLMASNRHLLLAGMTKETMALFDDVGLTEAFGRENLFPTQTEWFFAMNSALARAHELATPCEQCPLGPYLEAQSTLA